MKPILTIQHLTKNYHDKTDEITAIKDINLEVKDKEFVAIVGPSGCGKSTLLSILTGLDTASSGTIQFGKDHLKIGYMLQKDSLFPWRTILENCYLGLEVNHNLNEETKKRVLNLLESYGLKDFIHKYPSALSGGMRQRVG